MAGTSAYEFAFDMCEESVEGLLLENKESGNEGNSFPLHEMDNVEESEVDYTQLVKEEICVFSPPSNRIMSPVPAEPMLLENSPIISEERTANSSSVSSSSVSHITSGDDLMSLSDIDSEDEKGGDENPATCATELMIWAAKHSIRRRACNDILRIIKRFDTDQQKRLPKDFRTLYHNVLKPEYIKMENGGEMAYFGIANMLNHDGVFSRINDRLSLVEPVLMTMHIDGLPLFKSSKNEFWPILGLVFDEIFIIAVHFGIGKPSSSQEYLSRTIDEIEELQQNGIFIRQEKYMFKLRMLTADAPAKSFALNCIGHNGYSSCAKCWIRGEYMRDDHVMTFLDVDAPLRTNSELRQRVDDNYHKGETAFGRLTKFNYTRQITNDYMHSVCLGIWKAILLRWFKSSRAHQPCTQLVVRSIDNLIKFISANQYCPTTFARKPRPLQELVHFKATEFRQFLLYLGPVIFHKQLHGFEAALTRRLFCVMRTLCALDLKDTKQQKESALSFARENIVWLIQHTAANYGNNLITYNWHAFLHLPDDCRLYGSPDNFSAFCFESFLYKVKRYVRTGNLPLQQLVNRYSEYVFSRTYVHEDKRPKTSNMPELSKQRSHDTYDLEDPSVTEHEREVIMECDLYSQCYYRGMPLRTDRLGNSFCRLKSGDRLQISHFLRYKPTNNVYVQGNYLTHRRINNICVGRSEGRIDEVSRIEIVRLPIQQWGMNTK